jgi:VanZ family protein
VNTHGESFWQTFERLSQWSFDALLLPRPLGALVIFSTVFVVAFAWQLPVGKGTWRGSYWMVFTQLLFFPATVTVGVLFPAGGAMPNPVPNVTGRWCLRALSYLSLGMACFWVYQMMRVRWVAASLVALQEILILCAGFIIGYERQRRLVVNWPNALAVEKSRL